MTAAKEERDVFIQNNLGLRGAVSRQRDRV